MWPHGTGSNDTVGSPPSDNEGYFAGVQSSGNTSAAATVEDAQVVEELSFSTLSLVQVVVYCVLFVVAAGGNVPVFVTLLRNRHRKSRIKLMIMHLAIADMIVTFVMIPVEVIWRITGQWVAGDLMCKLMQTLRAFGPYLSSAVLVCISVDRYFAVLHPLKVHDAHRRGKIMLGVAWYASLMCSVPQAVIFRVMEHPAMPGFYQCVTFAFFAVPWHEKAYNIFCLLALYGVPLVAIVVCYCRILWEIHKQSKESHADQLMLPEQQQSGRLRLRRSDVRHITRARNRTLRLTIIIVLAFFLCWTPYVIMVLWYQIDPESASNVDGYVQSSLFMFAVSNSCVNPLVYGSFTSSFRKACCRVPRFWALNARRGQCTLTRKPSKQTVNSWVPTTPVHRAEFTRDCCSMCSSDSHDVRSVVDNNDGRSCHIQLEVRHTSVTICRSSMNGHAVKEAVQSI
ncbi:adipokinetic hormone/corazonin-related peptide receptor variant I-like [Dermacentor albipictus]|uniref:adipokinetic hormone/corazonin-related peptide receptor variant I-like n=1 Tax=Dermacentor albipictus TaxID=60249 RepID=UPI0038FD0202